MVPFEPYKEVKAPIAPRDMRRVTIAVALFCVALAGMPDAGMPAALDQDDSTQGQAYRVRESPKGWRVYMGVYMDELTARMRTKFDYPHKTGVFISSVMPESPAEKAGLKAGDILYLFDGIKIEDTEQLSSLVKKREPGDKVPVVVYREGKERKFAVTLGEPKSLAVLKDELGRSSEELSKALGSTKESMEFYKQSYLTRGRCGMVLGSINEDLAPYFGIGAGEGVLVLDVETKSPAAKAGIKSGDVIVSVNGAAVSDAGDVSDELSSLDKGDMVSIVAMRKGVKKTFELEIEECFGLFRFFVAPFEEGRGSYDSLRQQMLRKSTDEAAKLKEQMKILKEHLKELEDRLDRMEKKEQ